MILRNISPEFPDPIYIEFATKKKYNRQGTRRGRGKDK
jgi:hypothetical protein